MRRNIQKQQNKKLNLIFLILVILVFAGIITIILFRERIKEESDKFLFPNEINISEITNEENLIFSITRYRPTGKECMYVHLNVYNDGTYKLYNKELPPDVPPGSVVNDMLVYGEPIVGTYTFEIKEVLQELKSTKKPYYELTLGNGEKYELASSNEKLQEFLKSININLDQCLIQEISKK